MRPGSQQYDGGKPQSVDRQLRRATSSASRAGRSQNPGQPSLAAPIASLPDGINVDRREAVLSNSQRFPLPLIFNGKFYCGQLNGVHRVADRLIRQIDRILAEEPVVSRPRARIYVPTKRNWSPDLEAIEIIEDSRAHSQGWEQFSLPKLAKDGVLINLCNLGPLLHSRKLLLIHDVQFLFSDSSYPTQQRLGYTYLIPLMAKRAQRIMTVSDYSKRMLDVSGVSPSNKTIVIHNGVDHMLDVVADHRILTKLGLERGRFVLVFGSSKSYKNVDIVFQAFRDPLLVGQTLVVVGESEACLRASDLNPPSGAIFAGPVDDGQLRALYEHATCLVFPSKTEGFGLPPLEGMLLGCPAVVAPAGAIPEVCHDAVLYASTDDAGEWAAAIAALASDPGLRAAKVEAGLARAKTFTWQLAGLRLLAEAGKLAQGG